MYHQNIQVGNDITDADTGATILTHEQADQERERWTAEHPPLPGLRWRISFGIDGQVRDRHLEVIPGWEDAYAPSVATSPVNRQQQEQHTDADEANRLGALAYQGWFSALPEVVRDSSSATWTGLPEAFREPLRQAAVLVWQHGENTGFHQALLRTLPSAQLGAAGALEDLADFIAAVAKLQRGVAVMPVPDILAEIRSRVAQLRRDAQQGAKRAREQT